MMALSMLSESFREGNCSHSMRFQWSYPKYAQDTEEQHGGSGYKVWTKGGDRILEFCAAMNMTEENKFFKKRASHLNASGLVRRDQRKFLKDIKEVLPCEQFITKSLVLIRR